MSKRENIVTMIKDFNGNHGSPNGFRLVLNKSYKIMESRINGKGPSDIQQSGRPQRRRFSDVSDQMREAERMRKWEAEQKKKKDKARAGDRAKKQKEDKVLKEQKPGLVLQKIEANKEPEAKTEPGNGEDEVVTKQPVVEAVDLPGAVNED